jgi:D-amino-acid dehydrogenase
MRVLVLGAGVVGVTTAYELARDGHDVVVVDREPEAANFTSFANAGMVACGHAFAWASPKAPGILWKSLFRDDQPLKLRPRLDPRMWAWSLAFLRQCTASSARTNTLRKHNLCKYSQARLQQVVQATGVQYDATREGLLFLYRSEQTLARGIENMRILADNGQEMEIVDRDRMTAVEPALAPVREEFAGGVYCPTDETGDARVFSQALARKCTEEGVEFRFGTEVKSLDANGERIGGVTTSAGRLEAEAVVLSLGVYSPHLVRPLGIKLPIYPVKGYSVTFPLVEGATPPRLGGVDEDNLVAFAPMGSRLRVTSTAEFTGYDTSHRPSDFKKMLSVVGRLFPGAADFSRATYWAGLRPMTPEGWPRFGPTRYRNLFVNTGQGHMGWTMACGSARITADLIAGRKPEIDIEGMCLQ